MSAPALATVDQETLAELLPFKALAERIIGGTLSDEDYLKLVLGIGIEHMVEDILAPPERSPLWEVVAAFLHDNPKGFVEVVSALLDEGGAESVAEASERWQQYIG